MVATNRSLKFPFPVGQAASEDRIIYSDQRFNNYFRRVHFLVLMLLFSRIHNCRSDTVTTNFTSKSTKIATILPISTLDSILPKANRNFSSILNHGLVIGFSNNNSFNNTNKFDIIKKNYNEQIKQIVFKLNSNLTNKIATKNLIDLNKTKIQTKSQLLKEKKFSLYQINESSINSFNQTQANLSSSPIRITKLPFQSNNSAQSSFSIKTIVKQHIIGAQQQQAKRAPHYLQDKYRIDKTTATTIVPKTNLDHFSEDNLIEENDFENELDYRQLDEQLIADEGTLFHNTRTMLSNINSPSSLSSTSNDVFRSIKYNNLGLVPNHYQAYQEQDNLPEIINWSEIDCPLNCSCSITKWSNYSKEMLHSVNCSNLNLDKYPIFNEVGKQMERLWLANNRLNDLHLDFNQFNCDKLLELDLSDNQFRQLFVNGLTSRHVHPIVEFHLSHNHFYAHLYKENGDNYLSNSTLPITSTIISTSITNDELNSTLNTNSSSTSPATSPATSSSSPTTSTLSSSITTTNNKIHLFNSCHRLKILNLSNNDLRTLTNGCLRGMKRLRKLYLDNVQIKFVEKNAFIGVNELRLLSLRFNLLSTIHADMFQHMINLKVLDLTGNLLTYLGAGVFNSLVALQALHLDQNQLQQLNFQCFSGLDTLQLLTLTANNLHYVPRFSLQALKKIKLLDLSSNPIVKIVEDDFSHLFVQIILLNHLNKLKHVGRFAFWDLPYLIELQLTHNSQFEHLDEQAIVGAPALRRLRLDHNALHRLDERLLDNLARMTSSARHKLRIHLIDNPFKCDCYMKPVHICILDQSQCKVELPDYENITCSVSEQVELIKKLSEMPINFIQDTCLPNFVSVITPINMTIVKRLRTKLSLSCKAQGIPTPNVYWLQPSGEIHKEKFVTRHGYDLVESDLLSIPHEFQNDDNRLLDLHHGISITKETNLNQTSSSSLTPASTSKEIVNNLHQISNSSTLSSGHRGSSTLKINHLTVHDAGLYTCIAENRLGTIQTYIHLITQQLKIQLSTQTLSTNFITIKWDVYSVFNPPLNQTFKNDQALNKFLNQTIKQSSKFETINLNQNLNQLDYHLLYKPDNGEEKLGSETLGSERMYESNKFFTSYENIQINRALSTFTVAGLKAGSKYKICIAIRESRSANDQPTILDSIKAPSKASIMRKRSLYWFNNKFLFAFNNKKYQPIVRHKLNTRRRQKRNLISVESSTYLAINCLHANTAPEAFYARNILESKLADQFKLSGLLFNLFGALIKISLAFLALVLMILIFVRTYDWSKRRQRRSPYETPLKILHTSSNVTCRPNRSNNLQDFHHLDTKNLLSLNTNLISSTNQISLESIYTPTYGSSS